MFQTVDDNTAGSNLSRKTAGSAGSTPDMTQTTNDDITQNPYVPDNALAPTPLQPNRTLDSRSKGQHGGQGHQQDLNPFMDDYSVFDNIKGHDAVQDVTASDTAFFTSHSVGNMETARGGTPEIAVSALPIPSGRRTSDALLTTESSNFGNPFVPSDDDSKVKNKRNMKRVMASEAPAHQGNVFSSEDERGSSPDPHTSGQSDHDLYRRKPEGVTPPVSSSSQRNVASRPPVVPNPGLSSKPTIQSPAAGTPSQHPPAPGTSRPLASSTPPIEGDYDTIDIYNKGTTPQNVFADGEDTYDPFGGGSNLQQQVTALHDDPFNDNAYYKNIHAATPPADDDPFAQFGKNDNDLFNGEKKNHFAEFADGDGAQGPNRRGSTMPQRRQSQFQPKHDEKPQSNRRQSVACALTQSKPKETAVKKSEHHGSIDVVATDPVDNGSVDKEGYSTEDRAQVDKVTEQLFMPNLKREQYIPVRVAREKLKQVLAEMAQLKMKHLAAIDTMEKQHQFLKAQLETACAAYCRKLTGDYNSRVVALNHEYKRRLAEPSSSGGGGGGAGRKTSIVVAHQEEAANQAAKELREAEQQQLADVKQRCEELETELQATREELERALQQTHEVIERAEQAEDTVEAQKETIRAFEKKVAMLEASKRAQSPREAVRSEADIEKIDELERRIEELEEVNRELQQNASPETIGLVAAKEENERLRNTIERLEEELREHRGY